MALPELVRRQVEKKLGDCCEKRVPASARDQVRLEYEIEGNAATIVERRIPLAAGVERPRVDPLPNRSFPVQQHAARPDAPLARPQSALAISTTSSSPRRRCRPSSRRSRATRRRRRRWPRAKPSSWRSRRSTGRAHADRAEACGPSSTPTSSSPAFCPRGTGRLSGRRQAPPLDRSQRGHRRRPWPARACAPARARWPKSAPEAMGTTRPPSSLRTLFRFVRASGRRQLSGRALR